MPAGITVVTVSHNTRVLTALVLWSVHRFLRDHLVDVLVVDNASDDGSRRLLEDSGVCRLVANHDNVHHGPALTQAMANRAHPDSWVWILDSDCVVARPGAGETALAAANGAAVLGEESWDRWTQSRRLAMYSLLLDPAVAWGDRIESFAAGGDPGADWERSCRDEGVAIVDFPFAADGHVIHRGRSTLEEVHRRGDSNNELHGWAEDHHQPHFQNVAGAAARFHELEKEFRSSLGGELTAASLARACR